MPALDKIFDAEETTRDATIVILNDGETFTGADGCTIRRDGREFNILRLLDFWEAYYGENVDSLSTTLEKVEIK